MKKLILAVVVLMGVSSATMAKDDMYFSNLVETDFKVQALSGLKFQITGANLSDKAVVEIKDDQGYTIYKEVLAVGEFSKVYNLKSLQDGNYKIVLTSGAKSIEKPFEIETEVTRVVTPAK
ncbi:hypothetical protein LAG90_16940 [Marinilongibacter aquaticus]|uniref:hypothetical protein n=1 Tax=Marinilongibacter aquaticus TaxID=2975157 RepID=UPI0021BDE954|nr:hypothetical protein [Marinilongibacter aquaticus]UBM58492.1 hypothetical protein LAG90_16940 [Marinilongibacter aquaticus]